jgi:GTPase SAR1 family protein
MFALSSPKSASRLEQIAALRARGIGNHIDLPQLVVSGDQSAGKSSVLEGLTGLPFPRQDGLCTRFATEILLHHDGSEETKIEASLIPGSGRDQESSHALTAYSRTLRSLADLPDVISDAGELMGVRGFGKVTTGPSFSGDLLKIRISGPVGLHLSIVDLPGIILVPNEEQTEDDVDTVHRLVDQYLKNPRTIILAVVQAGNDIANQSIIRKSRKFDVDGERTVGIITKPDLINEGSEKRIALLAKNQDTTKLKLGYFLLKNPSPFELESQVDAQNRESREHLFFQTSPWKEQNLDKDRTGISALRSFLQKLLDRHIEHELPRVREEIETLAISVEQKLNHLGEERTELTEMRLFLSRLAMKFHSITIAALSGDYHDTDPDFFPHSVMSSDREVNRLRAMVHQLNMEFSHTMREDGQKRKIVGQEHEAPAHRSVALPANFSSESLSDGASGVNVIESSDETQLHVSREEMVEWVEEVSNFSAISIRFDYSHGDRLIEGTEEKSCLATRITSFFRSCSTSNLADGPT